MIFEKNEIISCVVVETLHNKSEDFIQSIFEKFKENTLNERLLNPQYMLKCPLNSVIVRINNPKRFMVLYPFFSSHVSLPIKPGEHVWAFFPGGVGTNNLGYWMTRRSTDVFIEDANFTHNVRSSFNIYENLQIAKEPSDNSNSNYFNIEGPGLESYQHAIENTGGNISHVFENIPRIKKKPGDTLIQGSNNNHLLLTSGFKENTGTIILTAGRGKTSSTSAPSATNTIGAEENNKATVLTNTDEENENEGKLDILNDKSIFMLSENPTFLNKDTENEEDFFEEMAVIFAKSDEIRIHAVNLINETAEQISLSCTNYGLSSDTISMNSPDISVNTEGWNVDMSNFFTIVKDLISELKNLASGTATFATGVGPTGPSTNLGSIQAILSRLEAMEG